MATLIFDIETVGETWNDLDETTQEVLTYWVQKVAKSETEAYSLEKDIKDSLGFSPLTGHIVALGVYDLERAQGVVYYVGNGDGSEEAIDEEWRLKERSERELLADFWEGAKSYDTFVTFNGRGFDVPFLWHRSAIQGIMPSRNLLQGRYKYQQKDCRHVDLQDELTFYGAMMKRPNLHLFCRAYGIESPKSGGVKGEDVAELFKAEKFRDIAYYNIRDVVATAELYQKYRRYFF